ncbi:hypothetical protein [Paenibacillus lutrae]|uniref:Uncharacterized protein n=1 Tax=Paenibacillus lutrae TaxID=2078573 RepID=A0A7X3FGK8_9BACL|nr:hypothetical protein [Paenibacillus lutrae]MVO99275.1 hypothetical protein [Paenibacillus lutrae]
MYNQYQNQAGIGSQSQYQNQNKFQPTGYVQSSYGQNQFQNSQYSNNSFQNPQAQSFHTANYRGDQPGHDSYLRSDSQTPAQQSYASFGQNQSYGSQNFGNQGYIAQGQSYGQQQFASPQSFHTANYRGDQPGHDSYLRSDSQTPSQQGYAQASYGAQSYGAQNNASQNFASQGYGGQSYTQQVSPQSYHTANYRGDQPAHDSYLTSDSQTPSQSQFAGGYSNNAASGRQGSGLPYTTGTF